MFHSDGNRGPRTNELGCIMDVWERVLGRLEERLGTSNFEIWIKPIALLELAGDIARLGAPNRYYSDWVRDNHEADILEEFSNLWNRMGQPAVWGPIRHLAFDVVADDQSEEAFPPDDPTFTGTDSTRARFSSARALHTHQTFDNFVVGACNQFAHAASEAVAEYPGTNYNPLFIYGCTGLGKTHLIHAIGNALANRSKGSRVMYTTAEVFVNEMINAIRFKKMEDFRGRYRANVDILLIDDIQFLSGKDRSQEEFFHTFEDLQSSGRQIVLTADVLPREIDKLEPRLRTRFEGGLLADIQPPDLETMLAILLHKSDELGIVLDRDLAEFVSSRVRGNIRELEGVLNRLAALSSFYAERLTLDFAKKHLGNLYVEEMETITADKVMEVVSRLYAIRPSDLKGSRKVKGIVYPRQIAMYLARKHTPLSFPDLGRAFCRDNSTVQYACKKIDSKCKNDPDLQHVIATLERNLGV